MEYGRLVQAADPARTACEGWQHNKAPKVQVRHQSEYDREAGRTQRKEEGDENGCQILNLIKLIHYSQCNFYRFCSCACWNIALQVVGLSEYRGAANIPIFFFTFRCLP